MTEPKAKARRLEPVTTGVWRWHVPDDRLDGLESDAFAIVRDGLVVLIDPLPIETAKLTALGEIEAIILTIQSHGRSAWRLRRELKVPVWAPEGSVGLDEKPDYTYSGGDLLPGDLAAFHAPGPCEASYVLWSTKPENIGFLGDIVSHDGRGHLTTPPAEYQDEPERLPATIERLVRDVPLDIACFGHGPPLKGNVRQALEAAVARPVE